MNVNPRNEASAEHFNAVAAGWDNSGESVAIAQKVLQTLGFRSGQSLLDVASGTGVIRAALQQLGIQPGLYLAVDISGAMLEKLQKSFPEAQTLCADFEEPFTGAAGYDCVLIYNSIPHFSRLDMLFANAARCLNPGGTFMFAHSRTRQGLREHHGRIGHISDRPPIPANEELSLLADRCGFGQISCTDEEFFSFTCRKTS
ncbi:hypothetical protein D3C75_592080 [compost metagenome]